MDHKDYPQDEHEMLPLELEFVPEDQEFSEQMPEQEGNLTEEEPAPPEQLPEETPELEEIPVYQEAPQYEEAPVEEPPVQEEVPAEEEAPIPEEPPVYEQAPEDDILQEMESLLTPREEPEQQTEEAAADQEYRDNGPEFDEMMNAPAPEKKSPSRRRPPRKGRPKKTTGEGLWGIPSILVTVVWLALVVAIGVTAGRMIWVCAADVLAFGREDKVVTVTIYERDTMEDITEKLYNAGMIRYRSLFNFYAEFSNAEEKIRPGIYDLNTKYDYHALVNFMSPSSNRTIVKVMIPEGYTCAQIFDLLEENKVVTAEDLAAYAATGELDEYWFLEDVVRGESNALEGFLFPDTYEFYKNDTPRNILQKMLDNFETRFDEEMIAQIDSLNDHLAEMMRRNGRSEDYIAENRFTVREVAIVASMIEKETAHSGESPVIASVIYNRLFNWGDTPAYLNIDAAIVYALDGKTDLTREDLQVESPYNTYLNTGLTPTPIANPGLTSLKAALNPESTNYYFYVLNPTEGSHQFSTTRDEHEANVTRFAAEG